MALIPLGHIVSRKILFDRHTTPKFLFYYYFPELIAAGHGVQALIRNTISFAWCRQQVQAALPEMGERQKWKESIPEPNLSWQQNVPFVIKAAVLE